MALHPLLMNRQKRHRRFICLFAALVLLAGCDLFGSDEEPGPVMVSEQSAQFGMRAIYGLNPEAATNTSPVIFFGIFLDDNGNLLSHGEEPVRVTLNGNEVNESYEFDYQPGNEYEFEVSLGDETIRASVKAPDILGIFITSMPDTVCNNEPLTVSWEYEGENPNDGIVTLVYDFRRSEAARLPPSTTSYTIPAETFGNGGWGDRTVQVISQRAVLFPKLAGDAQSFEGAFSDLGHEGSFFTTFVASEERFVHVLRSDQNLDQCR